MPQTQGSVGAPPSVAGKQKQLAEVDALTERPNAIDVGHGIKANAFDAGKPAADSMAVDEVIPRMGRINKVIPGRITVVTLTGRAIEVGVWPTDTVGRIKERVAEQEGIPPEQQRLILGGKQLADDKTVRESNITAGTVIHLVLALRGGRCY